MKKQFRRLAAGSDDDDDDSGPVISRMKSAKAAGVASGGKKPGGIPLAAGLAPSRSSLRHDFLDDPAAPPAPGGFRMQASHPLPDTGVGTAAVQAGGGGGEYSGDRLRALRASQLFRLSVASGAGDTGGAASNDTAPAAAAAAAVPGAGAPPPPPPPREVLVAVVEGGADAADADAGETESLKRAAALAKAKREDARRRGGGAPSASVAVEDPDDYVPLRLRATASAGTAAAPASHPLPRLAPAPELDDDEDGAGGAALLAAAAAAPRSLPLPDLSQPPAAPATAVGLPGARAAQQQSAAATGPPPPTRQLSGFGAAPAPADPAVLLRAMRATLAGAAAQARSAADAAEREVARLSAEAEEATAAATAARAATKATAAPAYDWYAGLRVYCEELTACVREKAEGVRALEAAADELEAAVTVQRARRRAADVSEEVAELTDAAAAARVAGGAVDGGQAVAESVTLVGCGGMLPQPPALATAADRSAADARRARRQVRRARIAAPLRRLSRALAAGRSVSTSDLHSLSDGDASDSETAYAASKRSDVAAAARLLFSDVDERYATPGAVLARFRPWKAHAVFGAAYANTLAVVSIGELVAVLVRADLAASWRLVAPPPPPPPEGETPAPGTAAAGDDDLGPRAGGGLGFTAPAEEAPRPPPPTAADPLKEAVRSALRQAGQSSAEDAGIDGAVAAATEHLTLDRFAWFRALWEFGEVPLAPGAAAAHPAAQAAEERLLPQVVQAAATVRLAAWLRHVYDPASLSATAVAVAALREALEYEPDATAVTSCVAALAARLQSAVNEAVLPVLLCGGGVESGGWHAVDDGGAGNPLPGGAPTPHPLTLLRFLELAKLMRGIAAWEFALAPALLRRLLEESCVRGVARPLLDCTAAAAGAALAAAHAASPPSARLAATHAAAGAVNLHGSLLAVLVAALPRSWRGGGADGPCAGLACADALAMGQAVAALQATAPGEAHPRAPPAWCTTLAAALGR